MQKTILNDVLNVLLENQLVCSESEFSREWLGRSDSYMRGLRFHNELPSISSIAVCASKLQHYGRRLAETGEHDELSSRFIALSDACHQQINQRCEEDWMAAPEMGSASSKSYRAV